MNSLLYEHFSFSFTLVFERAVVLLLYNKLANATNKLIAQTKYSEFIKFKIRRAPVQLFHLSFNLLFFSSPYSCLRTRTPGVVNVKCETFKKARHFASPRLLKL